MKAWRIAACVWCCFIVATGCCNTCQHPFDDCGPVWSRGACQNCNPDYRTGSILNRQRPQGPTDLAAERASTAAKPASQGPGAAPSAAQTARIAPRRAEASDDRVRATTIAQERSEKKLAPPERHSRQSLQKSMDAPLAPSPGNLSAGTVAAPPGTKEGDTRILSVTDNRLDAIKKSPKPAPAEQATSQGIAEKPSQDFGGWRPVANQQAPAETKL